MKESGANLELPKKTAEELLHDHHANGHHEDENGGALNRRAFIKASGAAAVFAGLTGCSGPVKKAIPYHTQPEELIPGNPVYYSSIDHRGENGLLVKTTEGRPIKLEGNPNHPLNLGKLDARGQADIMDLYDPDRLRHPLVAGTQGKWAQADAKVAEALKKAGSKAMLITSPIHGPAHRALLKGFKKAFPAIEHIELDLSTSALIESQSECYGKPLYPHFRFDRAELIVSLGFDFLSESPSSLEVHREFARAKKLEGGMVKVVSFEPHLSMLGASSDDRHRVSVKDLPKLALALAHLVAMKKEGSVDESILKVLKSVDPSQVEKSSGLKQGTLSQLADSLWEAKGKSLLMAGGSSADGEHGSSLLNATNLLNTLLGNDGKTVQYGAGANLTVLGNLGATQKILTKLKKSQVEALLIWDLNLAYQLPASTGFIDLLKKVPFKAGLFSHENETAKLCDVVLPTLHFLENWSDGEPRKGLFVLGQPTIAPLWDNRSAQDSLLSISAQGGQGAWRDLIKKTWLSEVYNSANLIASSDDFWKGALRKGIYDTSAKQRVQDLPARKYNSKALKLPALKKAGAESKQELYLYKNIIHSDGKSMNNPWLLETPDAVSRICWENFASVSVETAKKNDYKEGDMILLKTSAGELEVPVHIQPGVQNEVYAIALGWGRPEGGKVAAGSGPEYLGHGVQALTLAPFANGLVSLSGIAIESVKNTGKKTKLACVQGHQYLEDEMMRIVGGSRHIVQDATLDEFNDEHGEWKFHYHAPTDISMWQEKHPDGKHKWAMSIDTNACTACGACSVGCQAENNIPVVGKDEVIINREMHWIRIDRYYKPKDGKHAEDSDEVDVINQPMLCQHCDNAPCETVCPVLATTHSPEGLNVQTYNRCVGTRYCSNNCPYKVRHYNWYDYSDYRSGPQGSGDPLKRFIRSMKEDVDERTEYPLQMQFNPDVTVRTRGVMEKCSFCIQRITRWDQDEKSLGRELNESQKLTACQQSCPSEAITFGNILDKKAKIHSKAQDKATYHVLKELNAMPNIYYQTKLYNRKSSVAKHGGGEHHEAPAAHSKPHEHG